MFRQLGVWLLMPIIFACLVQCTTENVEQLNLEFKQATLPTSNSQSPSFKLANQAVISPKSEANVEVVMPPTIKLASNLLDTSSKSCVNIPNKVRIEIDISEQKLYLFCEYNDNPKGVKIYPISTSKYGIGNRSGSGKTPLGLHVIKNKIGDKAPIKTIFKARRNTGKIATLDIPGAGDLVTTRIMWLKGLEPKINSGRGIDSYKRYIYIHGTAEESKIGRPASHGCIRMYNHEVIELFERVTEGTEVLIKR